MVHLQGCQGTPTAWKLFLDYVYNRGQNVVANAADLYSLRDDVDGEATAKGVAQLIGDKPAR